MRTAFPRAPDHGPHGGPYGRVVVAARIPGRRGGGGGGLRFTHSNKSLANPADGVVG